MRSLGRLRTAVWVGVSIAGTNLGCSDEDGSGAWWSDVPETTTGGTAGVDTGDAGPPVPVPVARVGGRWGMYTEDTDAVVVVLSQDGYDLNGWGCYSGFPEYVGGPEYESQGCGEIFDGRIEGNRVRFSFEVKLDGLGIYGTDAYVDAAGERLAGEVSQGQLGTSPGIWLRTQPEAIWLSSSGWSSDVVWRGTEFVLVSGDGDDYVGGRTYRLGLNYRGGIVGDLGVFWESELTFGMDESGQPQLTAGPVAPTAPGWPVRLDVQSENGVVTTVVAETASGVRYTFEAAPTDAQ